MQDFAPILAFTEGCVDPADLAFWDGPVIPVYGNPHECLLVITPEGALPLRETDKPGVFVLEQMA